MVLLHPSWTPLGAYLMTGTAAAFIPSVRMEVTHRVLQLRQRHLPNISETLERDGKIDKAIMFQELRSRAWRGGSAVKSTHCSCRRPKFGFQHPCWADHTYLKLQLPRINILLWLL